MLRTTNITRRHPATCQGTTTDQKACAQASQCRFQARTDEGTQVFGRGIRRLRQTKIDAPRLSGGRTIKVPPISGRMPHDKWQSCPSWPLNSFGDGSSTYGVRTAIQATLAGPLHHSEASKLSGSGSPHLSVPGPKSDTSATTSSSSGFGYKHVPS